MLKKTIPFFLFLSLFLILFVFRPDRNLSISGLSSTSDALEIEAKGKNSDIASYIRYALHFLKNKDFSCGFAFFWPPGMALLIAMVFLLWGTTHYLQHMILIGGVLWAVALVVWYYTLGKKWPGWVRFCLLNLFWFSPFFRQMALSEHAMLSENVAMAFFSVALACLHLALKTSERRYFAGSLVFLSLSAHFRSVIDSMGLFVLSFLTFCFGVVLLKKHPGKVSSISRKLISLVSSEWFSIGLTGICLFFLQTIVWLLPIAQSHRWEKIAYVLTYYSEWSPSVRFRMGGLLEEVCVLLFLLNLIHKKDQSLIARLFLQLSNFRFSKVRQLLSRLSGTMGGKVFVGSAIALAFLFLLNTPWRLHELKYLGVFSFGGTELSALQGRLWWDPHLDPSYVTGNIPCMVDPERCREISSRVIPQHRAFWGYLTFFKHPFKWGAIKARHLDILLFGHSFSEAFSSAWSFFLDGLFFVSSLAFLIFYCAKKSREEKAWLEFWSKPEKPFNKPYFILGLIVVGVMLHQCLIFTFIHFEPRYILPLRVFVFFTLVSLGGLSEPERSRS